VTASAPRLLNICKLGLIIVAAVAIQTALISRLQILGVTADLFLILVVLVGVSRGAVTGMAFGFVAGLTADIVFLDPVGLRTLVYLATGFAVGRYVEEFGLANAWVIVLVTAVVSLVSQTIYGLFQFATGPEGALFAMMRSQMLPAAVLDGLLAAPLYLGLVRLRVLPAPGASEPSFR
jgi:rod shape-determining protein MreD